MANQQLSGQDKAINFLRSGKTLTPQTARSRYGIVNLRSTISHVRNKLPLASIVSVKTRNGSGYRMYSNT